MKKKQENPMRLLLRWAGPDRIWLILSVVSAFCSGLFVISTYIGLYRLMDAVLRGVCTQEVIAKNALLIAVGATGRGVFQGLSGVLSHKGAYGALFRVRCMVTEHLARMPLGALDERSSGDIKTVLNEEIEKLELFLAHNLPELVTYLTGPLVIFGYLLSVNIPLALVSLLPLFLAVMVMGVIFGRMRGVMERASRAMADFNSVMIEYIRGMRLIKAYNMGSKSFQTFNHAIREENAVWNEVTRRTAPPYAAFMVILDLPVFETGRPFPKETDIELRNVRFSYDGKRDVLRDCSLRIPQGTKTALAGVSGAGKSTVVELISRFYDVQEGEVLIGGVNVKDIDYEDLLAHISIVFQKTFLTRGSVLENIRMGSSATLEQVRAAAKLAQIDDFIQSLPQGYDTPVGTFESRFSGGERQRIAIARAILKNAPILILDEATSAADPENQVEIDRAIENLCRGKTVLIVAHRLGAIKLCNQVAVVEEHTITARGPHDQVRRENGYYRKAWSDYETARQITYSMKGGQET